jgi:hypothetical protein
MRTTLILKLIGIPVMFAGAAISQTATPDLGAEPQTVINVDAMLPSGQLWPDCYDIEPLQSGHDWSGGTLACDPSPIVPECHQDETRPGDWCAPPEVTNQCIGDECPWVSYPDPSTNDQSQPCEDCSVPPVTPNPCGTDECLWVPYPDPPTINSM